MNLSFFKNPRKAAWLILSIFLMGLIFFFSSQNGSDSSGLSGRFLFLLTSFLSEQQASFLIRKAAHFSIYFCLGFSINGVFLPVNFPDHSNLSDADQNKCGILQNGFQKPFLLSLAVVFLYACSDEWHQTFTDQRSGQFSDVLLDTCGGLCGILLHSILSISSLKNTKSS
ncbi:VanZ family protein [Ileibacterium valens]|uniref:VanZ family protein n=1 Tax=Ileibacterium valens TaxID=1862668 RepID=UPI002353135D|nr:VanZ family protein [Ileibacterium valens]